MQMKVIISHLDKEKRGEILRFGLIGALATLIQYVVYWCLIHGMHHNLAMTIGYVMSFVFNFLASTHYTFKVDASIKHGLGFTFSHVVNYLLQMTTLNIFLWIGVGKQWAPIPMFCICVPINFVLVRFFLKR